MTRDYPNMSYCMFNNTVDALNQILEAINDARIDGGVVEFFNGLSREERRNMQHLYNLCEEYMQVAEDIYDRVDEMSEGD